MTDEQRIAELEAELSVVTADNAAFLEAVGEAYYFLMKFDRKESQEKYVTGILRKVCHAGNVKHPGSRLLERLELMQVALEESVKFQSHYAKMLNTHDGGQRIGFSGCEEWIAQLRECGKLPTLAAYDKAKEPSE